MLSIVIARELEAAHHLITLRTRVSLCASTPLLYMTVHCLRLKCQLSFDYLLSILDKLYPKKCSSLPPMVPKVALFQFMGIGRTLSSRRETSCHHPPTMPSTDTAIERFGYVARDVSLAILFFDRITNKHQTVS